MYNTNSLSVVADISPKSRLYIFSLIVISIAFLQMNIQKVLYFLYGYEDGTKPIVFFVWTMAAMLLWWYSLVGYIRGWKISALEFLLFIWLSVLAVHAIFFAVTGGLYLGVIAFSSWAIWVGMFLYYGRCTDTSFSLFIATLLVCAAVFNGLLVIFEFYFETEIFKVVTRDNVTRRYGVSQSISILGLQLAVGIIAALFMLSHWRNSIARGAVVFLLIIMVVSLMVSTSRGPVVFLCIGLAYLLWGWKCKLKLGALVLYMSLALAAVISLLWLLSSGDTPYLNFLFMSFSLNDAANIERLSIYKDALSYFTSDPVRLLIGAGSGSLSSLAAVYGNVELGTESSLLKLFIELGIIGALPLCLIVLLIVYNGVRAQLKIDSKVLPSFIAMLIIVLFEVLVHEGLKSWIVQFYMWSLLACVVSLTKRAHNSKKLNLIRRSE